jgi:hypothetical protein
LNDRIDRIEQRLANLETLALDREKQRAFDALGR